MGFITLMMTRTTTAAIMIVPAKTLPPPRNPQFTGQTHRTKRHVSNRILRNDKNYKLKPVLLNLLTLTTIEPRLPPDPPISPPTALKPFFSTDTP